jgi:hypothetical protein
MVIERERYLDDSGAWLLSLGLRSRSVNVHSLLTALSEEERAAISDALVRALDEIVPVLRGHLERAAS